MDGVLRYEWFTTTERWLHRGLSDGDGLTYEEMMTTPILLRTRSNLFFSTARQVNPCFRAYSSINCNTPFNICFVRHGQSTWNRDNRFIGWTDTPLTEDGVLEARVAGRMLQTSGILFDEAHTVSIGVLYCLKTEELPAIRSFRWWFWNNCFSYPVNKSLFYDDASARQIWSWWRWARYAMSMFTAV